MWKRLRRGLQRSSERLRGGLGGLLGRRLRLDGATVEQLEDSLLAADVGLATTEAIIDGVRRERDADTPVEALRRVLVATLEPLAVPLAIDRGHRPTVILMVGVNGAGKTTTAAKLAARLKAEGLRVMLAAGDTFRAAAIEQLRHWAERADVPVVAQQPGADSAAVVFDAMQAARARDIDVLIADTAGRLHTQDGLMDELAKVVRVVRRLDPQAPHETLLVLDATAGQNALSQAREFARRVGVSGLVVTKLDGTARGGVLVGLAHELGLPVRFIGVGEGLEDLLPFDAAAFVDALLGEREQAEPATS